MESLTLNYDIGGIIYPYFKNWKDVVDENTVLVIDYDQIAFMSSAIEETKIEALHIPSGRTKQFKNKTEFWGRKKNQIDGWLGNQNETRINKGLSPFLREDFEISTIQIPPPINHCYYAANIKIETIRKHLGLTNYFGVVGSGENFRHKLRTPEKYKSSRDNNIIPIFLKETKDFLIDNHHGKVITGIEADDVLTTYGYRGWIDYQKTGKFSYIPVSMDKDGFHTPSMIMNPYRQNNEFKHIYPLLIDDGIGELWLNRNEVKGYGFLWFGVQMCLGDRVDHVRPYQDFNISYGDAQSYRDFKDCKTHKEVLEKIMQVYQGWFPDGKVEFQSWDGDAVSITPVEWASTIFKQIYMLRSMNDKTTLGSLFKKYGVSV